MLSFPRKTPPAEQPRPLAETLGAVAQLLQAEASARGVSLDVAGDVPAVELDGAATSAVRDALSNLLLNALHVTPKGGAVRVEAGRAPGRLVLSGVDQGPGVPGELRERIWEPFFTTKQRGTGLGLAIVRKRVEEVGGEARLAQPGKGEGARFELSLPLMNGPGES